MTIDELGTVLASESDIHKCYDAAVRCALTEHIDVNTIYRELKAKGYNYNIIVELTDYRKKGNRGDDC